MSMKDLQISEFKKKEAEFHSAIVDSYHDTAQLDSLRNTVAHEQFLQYLKTLPAQSKILELGCGLGQDGRALMNTSSVFQTEISFKSLEKAREIAEKEDLHGNYALADAESIPFKNESCDAIFMVASLHHTVSPEKVIAEMKRAVKKNGLIIIGIEPNVWQYYFFFPFIRVYKKYFKKSENYSPGDESTEGFSKNDFKKFAESHGLSIIKIYPVWFLNGFIHIGLEAIYRIFKLKHRIQLPVWCEQGINSIDNALAKIPLLNNLCWHWNVIMKKV